MVMVFHFAQSNPGSTFIQKATVIGQTGVDLFFVLSGFLITRILLGSRDSETYFRTFYTRRALRIFPLFYGYLIFHFFLLPWFRGDSPPPWQHQWWSWFYLQNIPATFPGLVWKGPGHFWSLAVEEHFYLFWPLAVWGLSRGQFKRLTLGVLVAAPLIRAAFLNYGLGVFYFTLTRMDALAFGAGLALLATSPRSSRFLPSLRWAAIILPCLLLPAFVCFSGTAANWLQVLKLSLIPASYAAVIGSMVLDPQLTPVSRLLSARPLCWIGRISYGLYVYHPLAFELSRELPGSKGSIGLLITGFSLAFLLAAGSYYFFEEPILRLKRHFPYSPERQRGTALERR